MLSTGFVSPELYFCLGQSRERLVIPTTLLGSGSMGKLYGLISNYLLRIDKLLRVYTLVSMAHDFMFFWKIIGYL